MDRVVTYPNALARVLDILKTGQFAMVGVGKVAEAAFGTATVADGFTCSPSSPATLSVVIGPGQVLQQANLEESAISSLTTDSHVVVKQGLLLDPQAVTLVPPSTVGQAVNVLIQVQYQTADVGLTTLNYYNAANPLQPLVGPSNSGSQQATIRSGTVAIGAKYGVVANSGSQVTPAPDAGFIGLFVVTLAYGQSSVTAGNISQYSGAPLIPIKLPQVPAALQAQAGNYALDSGSANAMAITLPGYTPALLGDGTPVRIVKSVSANTAAVTCLINGTSYPVLRADGSAFLGGELPGGGVLSFVVKGGKLYQAGTLSGTLIGGAASSTGGAFSFPIPSGARRFRATLKGGGAAGGNVQVSGTGGAASGGTGGGTTTGIWDIAAGVTAITGSVGAGGQASASPTGNGGNGGTTFISQSCIVQTAPVALGGTGGVGTGSVGGVVGTNLNNATASGGYLNLPSPGASGGYQSAGYYSGGAGSGPGGSSFSTPSAGTNGQGAAGGEPGSGGQGAGVTGQGSVVGGAGRDGLIIIEFFA